MTRKRKTAIIALAFAAITVAGTGTAIATGGAEEAETPITGVALERASAAAVAAVSGKVTDTEVGDEESYYEVEVTRADGSAVDVQLDRDFAVVSSQPDDKK